MGQTERLQIALAEHQRKTHALVDGESEDSRAVLSAQKISNTPHDV